MRRPLALIALGGLVVTGCGFQAPPSQALSPQCTTQGTATSPAVVLMAQSVPTASLLPCVALVPAGWSVHAFDARDGQTSFALNSDRAGDRAVVVRLRRQCDTTGATPVPSDEPAAMRFERVGEVADGYVGTRYYLFAGGCVTYDFHLRGEARAAPVSEASLALAFLTREEVDLAIQRESHGRLRLGG